jgi:hypothetical protein
MITSAWLLWALTQAAAPPQPAALPPSTVALVETYADGRTNYELTSAKPAWMWTPKFPRIPNWEPPAGSLPVTAVQISRVLAGRDVRVDVSLLLGRSHEQQVPVANVLVTPGQHVVVNALRKFGVEPIDLSLAEAAPLTPYLPTVFSRTPNVEIEAVSVRNAPYPGYRITVRNLSDKAAANFHVQAFGPEDKSMSLIPRGPEGRPVMTPGGTHTFDVNLTSGGHHTAGVWSPTPLDVIEIDSVLWADGSADGTPATASPLIAPDAGSRLQFTRVVEIMRGAVAGPEIGDSLLARIRSELEALPDQDDAQLPAAQTGMRVVKLSALRDLMRFERDRSARRDSSTARQWVKYAIERYTRLIARMAQ